MFCLSTIVGSYNPNHFLQSYILKLQCLSVRLLLIFYLFLFLWHNPIGSRFTLVYIKHHGGPLLFNFNFQQLDDVRLKPIRGMKFNLL